MHEGRSVKGGRDCQENDRMPEKLKAMQVKELNNSSP